MGPSSVHFRSIYRLPYRHDGVVFFFLFSTLIFRVLAGHLENAEFLCIDKLQYGDYIVPVHALEIIIFIKNFPNALPLLADIKVNQQKPVSILCDFVF